MAGEQAEAAVGGGSTPTSMSRGAGQQLRSEQSSVHSFVRFCNKSGRKADVIWFNYEGYGVKYKTLLPTQCVDVNTYVGHPWMFRDHDTGDRLVVRRQDVFKPEGYPPTQRWPPFRRTINITIPVLSLYEACMKRVRHLTRHQTMPTILNLQEWIPGHIVHDLIRQHKIAAIYYRMARGAYYGASSTSILDVHTPGNRVLNNGGMVLNNGDNEHVEDTEQESHEPSTSAEISQANGISVDSIEDMCANHNGLSINARHAHASRTLGLLSPCSVNTHSPGSNHQAHQEAGTGLLSTVQATGDSIALDGDDDFVQGASAVTKKSRHGGYDDEAGAASSYCVLDGTSTVCEEGGACDIDSTDGQGITDEMIGSMGRSNGDVEISGGSLRTNGISNNSDHCDLLSCMSSDEKSNAEESSLLNSAALNVKKGAVFKKTNSGSKIKSSKSAESIGKKTACDRNANTCCAHNNNQCGGTATTSKCCEARENNESALE